MKKAAVTVHPDYVIGDIDERLYSGYLEPIGHWVYGGAWNPEHPSADEMGFRRDVIDGIREMGMPAVRLPGGNFISGWDWKDSIGPVSERKARLDLAWRQIEPNTVGHDEYLEWSKRAGVEPLYTLNLGTADIDSAISCVEYTNHPGGTYWSDLRRKNGYNDPHGVKTWCLGNEMDGPWQISSFEKDPAGYGIKAHEISKAIKWVDPTIKTVVSGTCTPLTRTYPEWDVQVLEKCYDTVDYLSLHYYHVAPEGDINSYLCASTVIEDFLKTVISACDYVKAKIKSPNKMMISFDEYGSSFAPQSRVVTGRPGYLPLTSIMEFSEPHLNRPFRVNDPAETKPLERAGNEMLRALTLASILLALVRNADRVKIGCMTGAIGAALAYDRDNVWKTAVYHPLFQLNKLGRGKSILPAITSPTYDVEGYNLNDFLQMKDYADVSEIEAACVHSEENGEVTVFLINRGREPIEVELDVRGFEGYEYSQHLEMFDDTLCAKNSFDDQNIICPVNNHETKVLGGKVQLTANGLSWNVIRLIKSGGAR